MRNERCSHCGDWKGECSHCDGRGYFDVTPFGTRDCDECGGEGIKCERAYKASNCS